MIHLSAWFFKLTQDKNILLVLLFGVKHPKQIDQLQVKINNLDNFEEFEKESLNIVIKFYSKFYK